MKKLHTGYGGNERLEQKHVRKNSVMCQGVGIPCQFGRWGICLRTSFRSIAIFLRRGKKQDTSMAFDDRIDFLTIDPTQPLPASFRYTMNGH
jgi:hypothetical protein